ncbi:MAG: RIP metalloprotease RseP [Candidatus Saelkia tenebricola]|nr:RIP metalloprotease RseP [Candidatus Saelkia tenebricola]
MFWNILKVGCAFGIIVFIHELAHFLTAKRAGVYVEVFSLGFGAKIFSWKKNETEYRISIVPLGGYVKMAGEDPKENRLGSKNEFLSQPVGKRAGIVMAGPLGNYILGFLLFMFLFIAGMPTLGTKIGKILEGYPAEKAGLCVGDTVKAINGKNISSFDELTEHVHPLRNTQITVTIERDGEKFDIELTTSEKEIPYITGKKKTVGLIGIAPDPENIFTQRYGFFKAASKASQKTFFITKMFFIGIGNLLMKKTSLKESASGPIGIFYYSYQIAKIGMLYFISFMAVISISLALVNLLPIPVLDGGHLFFMAIEKLRGKPVSVRIQEKCTQVGMALLLLLIISITYFDIGKFFLK